jgi:hypothetical protein
MKSKDKYILVDRTEHTSRLNGGVFHRFTWYSVADGTYWETDADSAYNNYRKNGWDHLVQDATPWGAYQGLIRTDRNAQSGLGVITADSKPALQVRVTDQTEAQALAELDTNLRTRRNNYGDLFE